jgi:hypothetical protein
MTFLLNLISFFIIFGMISFLLICIYVFDYLKYRVFKRNRGINRYLRRR